MLYICCLYKQSDELAERNSLHPDGHILTKPNHVRWTLFVRTLKYIINGQLANWPAGPLEIVLL